MDTGTILFVIKFLMLACGVGFYLNCLYEDKKLSIIEKWLLQKLKVFGFKGPEINENLGKAHCIVMDLADALDNEDKSAQFRQTQVTFNQAQHYKAVVQNLPVDLSSFNQKPKLKVVKQ